MTKSDKIKLAIVAACIAVAGATTYLTSRTPTPEVRKPAPAAKAAATVPESPEKSKKPAKPLEHFGGGRVAPGSSVDGK